MENKDRPGMALPTVVIAILYLVISWLNWLLFKSGGILPMPIWPAAGLAVACCYRFGSTAIPGLWLGTFLSNALILGSSWHLAAMIGVLNAVAPFSTVRAAQYISRNCSPFEAISGYIAFIFLTVVLHPALTALGGIGSQYLLGLIEGAKFYNAWLGWWFAHATGTILFAPVLLSLTCTEAQTEKEQKTKYLLVFAFTTIFAALLFMTINPFPYGIPYLLIVPMAYVAVRYSLFHTMLLFTVVIIIGMTGIVLNPFHKFGDMQPLIPFRIMAVAYSMVLLMLSILRDLYLKTESVKESLDRQYQRLAENSPAIIYQFRLSADGKFSFPYINRTLEKILGLKPEDVQNDAALLLNKVHPDDREKNDRLIMESAQKLSPYHNIFRHEHQHGIIWLEAHSTPEKQPDGSIIWDGLLIDITDRKIAQEQLGSKTEELENYFWSALDLFCIADTSGRFLRLNHEWERTLGYKVEDLENCVFLDLVHPEDVASTIEAVEKLAGQQSITSFVNRYRHKDGSYRYIEWRSSPKGNLIYAAARDITDKLAAEKRLRESNDRLQAVMNSINNLIYIADMQTHELLFINQHGINAWGDNLVGQKCHKALQNLDDPCPFCTNEKLVDDNGKPLEAYRWEFQNRVNSRWYDIVDQAIEWIDGRIVRMEVAIDITQRKQIEQLLAAKNKELEQLVYVASHDLRSPLVNVDGYSRELEFAIKEINEAFKECKAENCEICQRMAPSLEDMTDALKHVRNSTRQMDNLLKGLLKLSRLGRSALNIQPIEMNRLIEEVVSAQRFEANQKNIEISIERLPGCLGDPIQMSQVFTNLIGNAIKYSDHDRQPSWIKVKGKVMAGESVYFVEDNGIGISPQHQENIFQIFHRLNPSQSEGEGLGLTIVKQSLGLIDGKIEVKSELGKGSTFIVTLPFARPREE